MNCTETVSSKHDFAEAFLRGIMCQNCTMENSLRTLFDDAYTGKMRFEV